MIRNRKYVKTVLQILIAVISGIALNLLTNTIEDPLKHVFEGEAYQYIIWLLLLVLIALYFIDARFGDGTTNEAARSPRQELIDGLTKRFEKRIEQKMDRDLRFEIHLNLQYSHERASERFQIDTLGEESAGDFETLFQRFTDEIRRLLIVGEPGSGKTVLLLKFARRLLDLARHDHAYPVPVILNLATWRDEGQSFETWVEQNLVYAAGEYGASKEQAKELIKDNKLLLLLDGLDEAPEADRDSCLQKLFPYLRAINARRGPSQTYPEVILCSRREEYNAMTAEAPVHATVLIQPLEPAQVLDALSTIRVEQGKGFSADRLLGEFTRYPALLSLFTTSFFVHIGLKLAEDDSFDFTRLAKSTDLVNEYVRQQINKIADRYSPQKALSWLGWLAGKLTQTRKGIIFELVDMQPYWLRREGLFVFLKAIMGGLFLSLLGTFLSDDVKGWIIVGICYMGIVFIWDNSNLTITIGTRTFHEVVFKKNIFYAIGITFILCLSWYAITQKYNGNLFEYTAVGCIAGIIIATPLGILLGAIFTLTATLIKKGLSIKINRYRRVHIKTKELRTITLKTNSGKLKAEFLSGFKKGVFAGVFMGSTLLIIAVSYYVYINNSISLLMKENILSLIGIIIGSSAVCFFFVLVSGLCIGVCSGVVAGLFNTFVKIQRYPRVYSPYRRFYSSLHMNLFQNLVVLFVAVYTLFSIYEYDVIDWEMAIKNFIFLGLLFTTITSSLYQHFVLRLCFYMEGTLLLRFVSFLNYVSKKTGLLENDGGQWRFRHQLIQDMLTEIKDEPVSRYSIPAEVVTGK